MGAVRYAYDAEALSENKAIIAVMQVAKNTKSN
jgi:hypothetical protein